MKSMSKLALAGLWTPMAFWLMSMKQTSSVSERIYLLTAQEKEILSHMSIVQLDDGMGGQCKAIRISGVNVQVVNGLGSTSTKNCVGNIVIGYNELGNVEFGDDRSGSPNLVIGARNSYASFGGAVVGAGNATSGVYASVLGGQGNIASGANSAVSGGQVNVASGPSSSISGGEGGISSGDVASISGGKDNQATSLYAAVLGGSTNTASGISATVSGGQGNVAQGGSSSVSGGDVNLASGSLASVSGGEGGVASGTSSSLCGGKDRGIAGVYDWGAGSCFFCDD